MTPQQVRDALGIYEKALQGEEAEPVRGDLNVVGPPDKMQRDHLLWMIGETRKIIASTSMESLDPVHLAEVVGNVEKAMRWLGFIQGGLWAAGIFSIENMKDHNR